MRILDTKRSCFALFVLNSARIALQLPPFSPLDVAVSVTLEVIQRILADKTKKAAESHVRTR